MDSRNSYNEKMNRVQTPSYLKDRVLDEVRSLSAEQAAQGASLTLIRSNKQKVLIPVLSAAAVLLIAIIAIPLLSGTSDNTAAQGGNSIFAQAENSFEIRPYTATGAEASKIVELQPIDPPPLYQELTAFGVIGASPLSQNGQQEGTVDAAPPGADGGLYTACLFSIKGQNIARVDIETGTGQIYCTEPGAPWQPRLLGMSFTIQNVLFEGSYYLDEIGFGYYLAPEELVDSPSYEVDIYHTPSALMASLDGQVFKIRVHYSDGSSVLETYILRVKQMKAAEPAELATGTNGEDLPLPYLPEEAVEGDPFVYVLFGEPI